MVQETVFSAVVTGFRRQKTNKLKLVKQCGRQAKMKNKIESKNKKINLLDVPEVTSFVTNLPLRGHLHWAWPKREIYGKEELELIFLVGIHF